MTYNLQEGFNKLANEWTNFKDQNNSRLTDLEKKGHVDPITQEQLIKINEQIDLIQESIIKNNRPSLAAAGEYKFSQNIEHKKAFNNYIRKGIESNLINIEKKSLSNTSDSDGGYFITRELEHNLVNRLKEISPLRRLASIQQISSDALEIIDDFNGMDAGWSNEGTAAETLTPKITKRIIPVHELYTQPKANQKLIDDAAINIEEWLEEKMIASFSNLEEYAFISGDGIAKPKGILSYKDGKEWGNIEQIKSGNKNQITYESILKTIYSLNDNHRSKSSIIMNKQTTFMLRSLKNTSTGEYIWSPCLTSGGNDSIIGVPILHSDNMPSPVNGQIALAIGDFKEGYMIVDRQNIKLMRDPFTEKPFVKFYITKRVGGDVKNFDAIKLLKITD